MPTASPVCHASPSHGCATRLALRARRCRFHLPCCTPCLRLCCPAPVPPSVASSNPKVAVPPCTHPNGVFGCHPTPRKHTWSRRDQSVQRERERNLCVLGPMAPPCPASPLLDGLQHLRRQLAGGADDEYVAKACLVACIPVSKTLRGGHSCTFSTSSVRDGRKRERHLQPACQKIGQHYPLTALQPCCTRSVATPAAPRRLRQMRPPARPRSSCRTRPRISCAAPPCLQSWGGRQKLRASR